jgi:hypothetical protein
MRNRRFKHSTALSRCSRDRRTHDYKRHGTTTLFAALNAQTREVITQFHQRHRSAQFREFLDLIEAHVPRRLDVHHHRITTAPMKRR